MPEEKKEQEKKLNFLQLFAKVRDSEESTILIPIESHKLYAKGEVKQFVKTLDPVELQGLAGSSKFKVVALRPVEELEIEVAAKTVLEIKR